MRFRVTAISTIFALCVFTAATGHAIDTQSLAQQALQAASDGKNSQALGLYELAISQSVSQPESVFGPLNGQYWQLIVQSDDFPRAFNFFRGLTAEQKTPNATLLANAASAIGGYFGWLQQHHLMADMTAASLQQMDATARADYNHALGLDPENFSALYGFAIYESYSPASNAKTHMQQLLTRLNSLRASHPNYPWLLVDYLQTHDHPQM